MSTRMEFYIKGRPPLAKPHHLKGVGLPNVYLLNGVEIEDDPSYGRLITITDSPGLHRAIGFHIATKAEAMTGDEVRFLRKQMRMTQEALAQRLRVSAQTVANYEKGTTANIGPADSFVRMQYALHVLPKEVDADFLRRFMASITSAEDKSHVPEKVRNKIAGRWHDDGNRLAA